MSFRRALTAAALLVALCLLTLSFACGRDEDAEDDAPAGGGDATEAAALTPYKPTGKEGTLAGTIKFDGPPPATKSISMDQDPVCAQTNPNAKAEDIVVNGDKLQNVFIYIKEGKTADQKSITSFSFDAPAQPATLDQHGCHYVPHVIGMQTTQPLQVLNSDATSHNVNVQAEKNAKFNQGQGPSAPPIEKKFARSEVLIPVKCNQHPWMRAYIGVLSHPFYAVSNADGAFEIKGVPPGTYTIVAWHEKYPQGLTQTVTIGPGENKQTNFTFTSGQLTAEYTDGSILEVMPAIEFPMLGHQMGQ